MGHTVAQIVFVHFLQQIRRPQFSTSTSPPPTLSTHLRDLEHRHFLHEIPLALASIVDNPKPYNWKPYMSHKISHKSIEPKISKVILLLIY